MKAYDIDSLENSIWTFSALLGLAEAGAFPLLEQGASLDALLKATEFPESVLIATLNLLAMTEFIEKDGAKFKASESLLNTIKKKSNYDLVSHMQSTFGQTTEFIQAAHKRQLKAGWHHTDESILEKQGVFSEWVATGFIPSCSELHNLAQKPGAKFLDVGTGVGKISIKMCELYPELNVAALEPADQPFKLAQKNIQRTGLGERIELRKSGVEALADKAAFDIIWVPQSFISDDFLIPGLKAIKMALKPGGIILTSANSAQNTIASSVRQLIDALRGGNRTEDDVRKMLSAAGFSEIKEIVVHGSFKMLYAHAD